MNQEIYWKVAVDAPISEPLIYRPINGASPDSTLTDPQGNRGRVVKVPLGKRTVLGVVVDSATQLTELTFEVKPITEIVEQFPQLTKSYLEWVEWNSTYYQYPIGQTLQLALPPLQKKVGRKQIRGKKNIEPAGIVSHRPTLNVDQQNCVDGVLKTRGFGVHLVFGITGSGKTEVYLHLLEKVLYQKQAGIVLVPEISLTPQLIQRFEARFGENVAVIHSQLSDREKTNQWWAIVEGRKSILVGARSALFCPIPNLGLIILDEEHESSFKQEEYLKYHARDSAIMRGKFQECPVILGSATPSLETWKNALDGKYQLHRLPSRAVNQQLPTVQIVDLRKSKESGDPHKVAKNFNLPYWMSAELYLAMREGLRKEEQIALFLNRRGVAHTTHCPGCGHQFACPNCAVTLTLHGHSHLVCHYCDYRQTLPEICPKCKEAEPKSFGLGTEKIENEIKKLFPNARIARADRDEIQNQSEMEHLIRKVEDQEIDVLIGTQMIAKGLDFPHLTLVGIILADVGLSLPDFRASERSFQLLTQMSGRAGRHTLPGHVILQTYDPNQSSIRFAVTHDFEGFAGPELESRKSLRYPPYGRLTAVRIQGSSLVAVQNASQELAQKARELLKTIHLYEVVQILGPSEAPLSRLRGKYRYHILIKAPTTQIMRQYVAEILKTKIKDGVKVSVDIDPNQML